MLAAACLPAVDHCLRHVPEARGLVVAGGGRRRQRLVAVSEVAASHAGHPRLGRDVARGRSSLPTNEPTD
jgi:hypothetical protein